MFDRKQSTVFPKIHSHLPKICEIKKHASLDETCFNMRKSYSKNNENVSTPHIAPPGKARDMSQRI